MCNFIGRWSGVRSLCEGGLILVCDDGMILEPARRRRRPQPLRALPVHPGNSLPPLIYSAILRAVRRILAVDRIILWQVCPELWSIGQFCLRRSQGFREHPRRSPGVMEVWRSLPANVASAQNSAERWNYWPVARMAPLRRCLRTATASAGGCWPASLALGSR